MILPIGSMALALLATAGAVYALVKARKALPYWQASERCLQEAVREREQAERIRQEIVGLVIALRPPQQRIEYTFEKKERPR